MSVRTELLPYTQAAWNAFCAFHNTACGWDCLSNDEREAWMYAARAAIQSKCVLLPEPDHAAVPEYQQELEQFP